MSWAGAKKDARRWVDSLNLPTKSVPGKQIDLNEQAKSLLRYDAKYRTIIIRAAKRLLCSRSVNALIDEPKPLGQDPEMQEEEEEPLD